LEFLDIATDVVAISALEILETEPEASAT